MRAFHQLQGLGAPALNRYRSMTLRCLIIGIIFSVIGLANGEDLKIGTIVESDPSNTRDEVSRFRFRADFNYDGVSDVAVSSDRREFGKMGGNFAIYLGIRNGKWRYVGGIDAHPLAVHLEKLHEGEGILRVYLRSSGSAGGILRYSISLRGVKEIGSKQIHPGDGGTDEGRAEYAKYFDDAIRLKPELSSTIDGKIIWTQYDR